jgi:hypothetical protein
MNSEKTEPNFERSAPYFLVHHVELVGGVALVDGRLGESSLKRGHVFSRSFECVDAWRGDKSQFRSCMFLLGGIEAYRHSLDQLDGGMTARLRLEGEGLDLLPVAKVLE